MKATPLAVFAALILAALCAFFPAAASAQGRDNVFAVAGVYVDETAANSAAAQTQGLAAAQRIGFERLARRLTTAEDQARLALPRPEGVALDRLVQSVDIEQERRSGTRYIGRLTVRYDAQQVRALLQQAGFTLVETRTAPVLVAPQSAEGTPEETAALWRTVWTEGGYGQELVPLAIAPASLTGEPDWSVAQAYARGEAAGTALYATLRVQGANASAQLIEVGPNNVRRDRGTVVASIAGQGEAGLRAALQSLADQTSTRLQNEWKSSRVSTGTGPVAGGRSRVSASALYADQRQWERIKGALEAAASTLISEIRIEAVGREGALVSFSYTGSPDQLGAELNRRGISLEQSASGPVLRVRR